MPFFKVLVLACAVVLGIQTAGAERPKLDADRIAMIDQLVEDRMAAMEIPGVALALIEDGEIVHLRGFGATTIEGPAVTEDTRFLIGSVSKPLISLTILDMVADGVVGLDDPVVQYIPSFQTRNATRSDTMTVRHLLSHRSGFSILFGNRNHAPDAPGADSMDTILDDARRVHLKWMPGEQFEYSNANYQLLGYLIEVLEDAPLDEIVATRLAAKYGLENTQAGLSPQSDASSIGHRYWFGRPSPYRWDPDRLHWAQGGIESTASDLANVLVTLIDRFDQPNVAPLWVEMISPPLSEEDAYGYYSLGWFVTQTPERRVAYHSGLNPGYEALVGFSPDDGFGFVILANAASSFGVRNIGSLHYGVVDLILDRPVQSMEISPALRVARIGAMVFPFLILIWIAAFVWKLRRQAFSPLSWNVTTIGWRLLAPSILLGVLAYALFVIVPTANNASFISVYVFQPDLGLTLGLGAALAGLWSLVRFGLRVTLANRS